jgi:hypothetical protein
VVGLRNKNATKYEKNTDKNYCCFFACSSFTFLSSQVFFLSISFRNSPVCCSLVFERSFLSPTTSGSILSSPDSSLSISSCLAILTFSFSAMLIGSILASQSILCSSLVFGVSCSWSFFPFLTPSCPFVLSSPNCLVAGARGGELALGQEEL